VFALPGSLEPRLAVMSNRPADCQSSPVRVLPDMTLHARRGR